MGIVEDHEADYIESVLKHSGPLQMSQLRQGTAPWGSDGFADGKRHQLFRSGEVCADCLTARCRLKIADTASLIPFPAVTKPVLLG